MAEAGGSVKLKQELGLWDVYALATGPTVAAGIFLLPGLAAAHAGAAFPLSYLVAALFLLPGLLSKAELATAMPRAGGVYYFLDRSMGPLPGTIGGLGTWIGLILKSAFALIGIGAYLGIFLPELPIAPIAAGFAVLLGVINVLGAKKSGSFQVLLTAGLLILLAWFIGVGAFQVEAASLTGVFSGGGGQVVATAGLVAVSYMGITKVASMAEEVKNPERNLPLGMILGYLTVLVVYLVGTTVMVGVAGADALGADGGDLAAVAHVADVVMGHTGSVIISIGAVLAFVSVANAGILAASRYPLAMSRDQLFPPAFAQLGSRATPVNSIAVTVGLILFFVLFFDPSHVAELAGAFQLALFASSAMAVIVMRESRIESYDPAFRSPFYPWLHILGILAPAWLIVKMGWLPTLFTGGIVVFGAWWYSFYGRRRVVREGAIFHVFERLGRQRDVGLNRELRQILKEKGLRAEDRFDETVARAVFIEAPPGGTFDEMVWEASARLAQILPATAQRLGYGFVQGTSLGMTPVSRGAALPHLRLDTIDDPVLALVRSQEGLQVMGPEDEFPPDPIHAVFFLVSPEDQPGQHLRLLAQLAGRVDTEGFIGSWLEAPDEVALKATLLQPERCRTVDLDPASATARLVGLRVREAGLGEGVSVALLQRDRGVSSPTPTTTLREGDRITLVGDPAALRAWRQELDAIPARDSAPPA